MQQFFFTLPGEAFGGQNQIVNEQEQQREVNPGGLSQTDSEKTLLGPVEEPKEDAEENEEEGSKKSS